VLAAALARGASREALVPALRVAMDAASAVAGAWGATTGLPPSAAAQATLAAALGRSPP
jgi:hypothetical protein